MTTSSRYLGGVLSNSMISASSSSASGVFTKNEHFLKVANTSWPTAIPNNPAPVYVSSTTATSSSTSSFSMSISIPTGCVAILYVARENPNGNVSGVSGLGTWARRYSYVAAGYSSTNQQHEIWWLSNTTGATLAGSITVSYSTSYDDLAAIVSYFSGCNLTNPWPTTTPYPGLAGSGFAPTSNLTTDRGNALGLAFVGSAYSVSFSPAAGWTTLNSASNSGASYWMWTTMWYRSFSTQQTSLSVASTTLASNSPAVMILDYLVG